MMTRTYANKNIRAVLKQEMKNCNITKTFPRADIWAHCQLFKTTVNGSAVAVQYGGSCAKTGCIWEGKILATLGGRRMKNKIFRVTPNGCFGRWNTHQLWWNGRKWTTTIKYPEMFSTSKINSQLIPVEFTGTLVCKWRMLAHGFYSLPFPNFL